MKRKIILLFVIVLLHSSANSFHAQSIRPIRDDVGFCWKADEMDRFMKFLSNEMKSDSEIISGKLIGGVSVHDDYLYAGKIYYPLFKQIKTKEVIIFGVTHGTVRKEMNDPQNVLILDEYDKWKGPYNEVEISPLREIIKSELDKDNFIVSNKAHNIEHSIEALIPFLQYYNRDIKITPIMVTQMPFERMEEVSRRLSVIIMEYAKQNNLQVGKDIFFLISNDANHYGEDFNNLPYGLDAKAHETATKNDKRIITENLFGKLNVDRIKKLTSEIWPNEKSEKPLPIWCGRYPIVFGLLTIQNVVSAMIGKHVEGKLFQYSDTFTEKVLPIKNTSMGLTAPFSYRHWCGWFTLGLYAERM